MLRAFREVWKNPYLRVAVFALLALGLLWTLRKAQPAITPLAVAFAFSYLTNPVVRGLERRRVPRFLGVTIVYAGFLLFMALATVLMATMVSELSRFVQNLPAFFPTGVAWVQTLTEKFGRVELPPALQSAIEQASSNLQGLLQGFLARLLAGLQTLLTQGGGSLLGLVQSLAGGVFQLVTAFTISIYLLYDFPKISQAALHAVPEPYRPFTVELAGKLDRAVGGYVRGQLLVALTVGTVVGIGLWIVGIPFAPSLGFLAAVFNVVPFVGIIISSIPAILLAASIGWTKVLLSLLVLWLANQLEGNVISPVIMRKATSLHPVTAIFAILSGAAIFGFWGALLAVPTAACLKVLYTDYYQQSRFYREG